MNNWANIPRAVAVTASFNTSTISVVLTILDDTINGTSTAKLMRIYIFIHFKL